MPKWHVHGLGKNHVEVKTTRVRYNIRAISTSLIVEVFQRDRSVEKVTINHTGSEYSLEGVDSRGRTERRLMRFSGNQVASSGIIGGKPYEINSSGCGYGQLLVALLKKRKPIDFPHIAAFLKAYKNDGQLKEQVQSQVDMIGMIKQPDSVFVACIIVCFGCALGDRLSCVLCDLCLETPT